MKSSSLSRALGWARSRPAVSAPAAPWPLVLVILAEFTKAVAAAHRYERLKYLALEGDDPAATNARRVYMEFYADTYRTASVLALRAAACHCGGTPEVPARGESE
jgi:hypothetical protein